MKTAYMDITLEAVSDILLCRFKIDITNAEMIDDGILRLHLKGDDLPEYCSALPAERDCGPYGARG